MSRRPRTPCRILIFIITFARVALALQSCSQPPLVRRPNSDLRLSCGNDGAGDKLKRLWQVKPFEVIESLMDRVLDPTFYPDQTPLINVTADSLSNQPDSIPVPSQLAFNRFYMGQLSATSHSIQRARKPGPPPPRRRSQSFRLDLAYRGSAFCGWQRQASHELPSVQQTVEDALEDRDVRVAGRTDAGVHAFQQVARVRTGSHVSPEEIQDVLREASDDRWRCWRVTPMPDKFHPTFGATSRSYAYMVDADAIRQVLGDPSEIAVQLTKLFEPLVGKPLQYIGVSYGKPKTQTSLCTLQHLRAVVGQYENKSVLIIELTGDRFLRRMVRILVATALMHYIAGPEKSYSSLLETIESHDRRLAALPAPPQGLIFVKADFGV